MFLCFPFSEHLFHWSKHIFCLEEVGILLRARIKICIFELFPTSSKVAVDRKIFIDYELLWELKIVCFTSFMDQFKPGKWKKSLKVKNFEVVNSAIRAIFIIRQCKKLAAGRWNDSRLENFILKYFQKPMPFQLLLDQDIFMGKV